MDNVILTDVLTLIYRNFHDSMNVIENTPILLQIVVPKTKKYMHLIPSQLSSWPIYVLYTKIADNQIVLQMSESMKTIQNFQMQIKSDMYFIYTYVQGLNLLQFQSFTLYLNDDIYPLVESDIDQQTYINHDKLESTKLIACVGSGKTYSIIHRIRYLVKSKLISDPSQILVMSFSRNAIFDFKEKCRRYNFLPSEFIDYNKQVYTIDSFAKYILMSIEPTSSHDVELLSFKFKEILKKYPLEILTANKRLSRFKYLLIDEAQDLNQTQYEIVSYLHSKLNYTVGLIGDPNQNIYQFRESSNKYLLNFMAKEFCLRYNHRSTQNIIDFAKCIRPYSQYDILKSQDYQDAQIKEEKIHIHMYRRLPQRHTKLLDILNNYILKNVDLSDIAILSPVRSSSNRTRGSSILCDFLALNSIPFEIFYDETKRLRDEKVKYEKKRGCLNILTYTGTKGLEWDHVILMDFDFNIMNRVPTYEQYCEHKYLLHVATSRAKREMHIFSSTYLINPVVHEIIDPEIYISNAGFPDELKYKFLEREFNTPITSITLLLDELKDHDLAEILDNMTEHYSNVEQIVLDDDYCTDIDRKNSDAFLGQLVENVFYYQIETSQNKDHRPLKTIEFILNSNIMILTSKEMSIIKSVFQSNTLTWELFDLLRPQLTSEQIRIIETKFKRSKPLEDIIPMLQTGYNIIATNIDKIKQAYEAYNPSTNPSRPYNEIINDIFYLTLVEYAINVDVYYYIQNDTKVHQVQEKHDLLKSFLSNFEKMNKYAEQLTSKESNVQSIKIQKDLDCKQISQIEGTSDLIITKNNSTFIAEVKTTKELLIRHKIQLLLYNLLYFKSSLLQQKGMFYSEVYNFYTNEIHKFIIQVNPNYIIKLLSKLVNYGNIKLDLTMVYDLETTGLNTQKDQIVQMSIIEYHYEFPIINTLVKPSIKIPQETIDIHNITDEHVALSPSIDEVRTQLKQLYLEFRFSKFIAHNGTRFDHIIMKRLNLFPEQYLLFDSVHLLHSSLKQKLIKTRKLTMVYKIIFGKDFDNAHSADADVFAVIRLMKHFNISI
jgi:hypothetical protein